SHPRFFGQFCIQNAEVIRNGLLVRQTLSSSPWSSGRTFSFRYRLQPPPLSVSQVKLLLAPLGVLPELRHGVNIQLQVEVETDPLHPIIAGLDSTTGFAFRMTRS